MATRKNTHNTDFVADTFDQMHQAFAHAARSGVELQTQAVRMWADFMNRNLAMSRQSWDRFVAEIAPAQKQAFERVERFVSDQAERTVHCVEQAAEVSTAANPSDAAHRWTAAWRSGFDSARATFDSMNKAGADTVENWNHWVRGTMVNGKATETANAGR